LLDWRWIEITLNFGPITLRAEHRLAQGFSLSLVCHPRPLKHR
jgi:hypothetical protein